MLTYVCVLPDGAEARADDWIGYESIDSYGRQKDEGLCCLLDWLIDDWRDEKSVGRK